MSTSALRGAVIVFGAWLATGAQSAEPGESRPLEAVEVTGERVRALIDSEVSLTPGSVTVIDAASLERRSVTSLADLFRYVPGVWAESYNGNDDVFYSSRGSNLDATDYDKNGVKFLLDGLPVTAADGNNHNRAIDPENARYVTVAHGANALAYGASTLGGAVDVTVPTARTVAPITASLSAGSFGQWGGRITAGGSTDSVDGLLAMETRQRDGFRRHSRQDRKAVDANFGWRATEAVSTRFYLAYSDYFAELPRELTPAQYAADPWQARADAVQGNQSKDVEALRVAFTTSVDAFGGRLEFGASHERQSLYHPIVSTPFFSLLIDTDHADSGGMARFRRTTGAHELLFGVNYGISQMNGANYENLGGRPGALMWITDDDASSRETFAVDRWQVAKDWTLVYGAQHVAARRDAGGFEGRYQSLNPRIGVVHPTGQGAEWYASASRVYEPPTTFELADDATGGSNVLAAMNGVALESGVRGATSIDSRRWSWDITAYYTALRNEILSIDDPRAPGTSLSANVDRTTHAGIEALVAASIAVGRARLEPLLSATYNAFRFDADAVYGDNRLPAAPRWFARGEFMLGVGSGLRFGPTFDFVGARYVDFANTYRVGGHALLGARASIESGRWQGFLDARNLLDRRHVATVAVKDRVTAGAEMLFPGAPRSVQLGARFRY